MYSGNWDTALVIYNAESIGTALAEVNTGLSKRSPNVKGDYRQLWEKRNHGIFNRSGQNVL